MDRETLESTATDNAYLRGLLAVPVALLMVLAALGNWSVGPFRHTWEFLACVGVLGMAYLLLRRYYNETSGRVTPSPRQQQRMLVATLASVLIMVGVSTVLRSRAPWSLDLPVNPIATAFALVLFVSFAVGAGIRR